MATILKVEDGNAAIFDDPGPVRICLWCTVRNQIKQAMRAIEKINKLSYQPIDEEIETAYNCLDDVCAVAGSYCECLDDTRQYKPIEDATPNA